MKKTISKKPGHWFNEIHGQNYYFFLEWDLSDVNKYLLKKYKTVIDDATAHGKCIELSLDDEDVIIIWTEKESGDDTLVHECVHAAYFTLNDRGISMSSDQAENTAYLVETIFRKAKGSNKGRK